MFLAWLTLLVSQELIRHPYHAEELRKNDIALIRLALPINFNFRDTIRPACLHIDVNDVDPTTQLTQFGWGIENWLDRNALFHPFIYAKILYCRTHTDNFFHNIYSLHKYQNESITKYNDRWNYVFKRCHCHSATKLIWTIISKKTEVIYAKESAKVNIVRTIQIMPKRVAEFWAVHHFKSSHRIHRCQISLAYYHLGLEFIVATKSRRFLHESPITYHGSRQSCGHLTEVCVWAKFLKQRCSVIWYWHTSLGKVDVETRVTTNVNTAHSSGDISLISASKNGDLKFEVEKRIKWSWPYIYLWIFE